ncbi:SGNH/GDSL hydrolase family protein [Alteromonas sp. BMJM2]|uniref:SGNH/GDSL hydrolase family protein n=1 Tax=Alteromonas sp. BMJM2 TaxID=2954241 RepID=UPI0022B51F3D|nr:SGNH/GDSL hydrolase family protein [Alteromonas sp. BMJM2]
MIWFNVLALNIGLIVILPVIIIQAIWVRKKTLRLPEPSGARQLKSEPSDSKSEDKKIPFNVLVIGDSAAAGVGVSTQTDALTGKLYQTLSQSFGDPYAVSITLHARTGLTSSGIITLLKQAQNCRYDVAVVSIGVNDVTRFTSLKAWRSNLRQIHHCLLQQSLCKLVIYSGVPPMHAFPAIPQPLRFILGQRASLLNRVLASTVSMLPFSRLLQLNLFNFNGEAIAELMAEDGFHPSDVGYALWAEQIVTLINIEQGLLRS